MSLKIRGWRRIVKWTAWSAVGLLFLTFIVKVATFENWYYSSKDGSERAIAVTATEELDEEEPTVEEVDAYAVEENKPRYLTVEKLGIVKARVLPMGVNTLGELATPNNVYDVGWYEASGLPGRGGTMIIDGHNGGPHVFGVFKNLPSLVDGDMIEVERGDGKIFKYRVVDSEAIPLGDADAYMAVAASSPEPGRESVTLISCTGEWSDQRQTYLSRQFVRAVLEEETDAAEPKEADK